LKREAVISLLHSPIHFQYQIQKKIKSRIEYRLGQMRKLRNTLVEKRTA
jgi:hypothetical protein